MASKQATVTYRIILKKVHSCKHQAKYSQTLQTPSKTHNSTNFNKKIFKTT